ncbi:MAG: hypothetical protein RIQ33_1911 [Bacteroidota bacterium]|jgi:hypothetical protein
MKTVIFIIFIMLLHLFGFSQATHYSIPNAPQQPKWVMPLWFEDAIGQRDTIYFCYQPKIINDSLHWAHYGMYPKHVDTSKMQIGWGGELVVFT